MTFGNSVILCFWLYDLFRIISAALAMSVNMVYVNEHTKWNDNLHIYRNIQSILCLCDELNALGMNVMNILHCLIWEMIY